MRKTAKWFLCLALIVAVVCGAMTAFAQEQTYVAENVQTGQQYEDVSAALQAADDGQIVKLLQDTEAKILTVGEETTLDLNGYELTATYASVFGNMIDGSAENTGALKVDDNKLLINTENKQLPVKTDKGYRFVEIVGFNTAWVNDSTFVFQPLFEAAACDMLKNGAAATGVSIQINVTWRPFEGSEDLDSRTFKYGDNLVTQFVNSYDASTGKFGRMFTLTLVNPENYVDLQCNTKVVSTTRVEFTPAKGSAVLKQEVLLNNEQASAIVAEGTKVQESGMELILSTTEMETSTVVVGEGETARALDIHVAGIAKDNAVPVIVTVKEMAANGLNEGNIALYHVENNETVEMTRVYTIEEVDEHNEYYYDIATGDVTMAMASFSEVAVVADEIAYWKGEIDTSWYNTTDTTFNIYNADQLAGFGAIVDGTASGIAQDSFKGKTVNLCLDVYLSDGNRQDVAEGKTASQMFNPIGYGYDFLTYNYQGKTVNGKVFEGTFDGTGKTVHNMFMNGWDMESKSTIGEDYTYSAAGAGLFASVKDATIKNLTVNEAQITMECVDMGIVVGYANGNCTFENIIVKNSTIGNYQRCTGGAIGEVGNGHHILKNVDVEASTIVSSLWGDFDAPLGGIIGGRWAHSYNNIKGNDGKEPVTVYMENCDVAAEINAYNDVTSAYQWYSYRRAGMLIGNSEVTKTVNGRTEGYAPYLTTVNCTVQYGDWAKYHYCEFCSTTSLDARYPWVRVEAGDFCGAYSNVRYGVPQFEGDLKLDVEKHTEDDGTHIPGDGHNEELPFYQLYGGGQGVYGGNTHIEENLGVTVIAKDGSIGTFKKFKSTGKTAILLEGQTVTLGDVFEVIEGQNIIGQNVYAFVAPADADSTVPVKTVEPNMDGDWQNYVLPLSGMGKATVTICDYYYCEATTVEIQVYSPMTALDVDADTVYAVGQDINIKKVTVSYANGEKRVLSADQYDVAGMDMSFGGKKYVVVSYSENGVEISKTVVITVSETFSSLMINADKATYKVGETPVFTVSAIAPDGTKSTVTAKISGADTSVAGIKTVTATLGNKTTTCKIYVVNTTKLDDTASEHALFWFYNHNFMLGGVNSVKTNAYNNYLGSIFTGSNGEKGIGFNNVGGGSYAHAGSPTGQAVILGDSQYDLTVTSALPYTYIGIRCIAGYDAQLLGFGYYVDGDVNTLNYEAPMYYSEQVLIDPGYQQFIALGGQDTAEAQTKVMLGDLGFTEGSTHTVTWVAIFENGIQHISDWTVTMKSSFGSSEYFKDTAKPNVNVIVLAGQSNASGATPITAADIEKFGNTDYKNVFIKYRNITVNETDTFIQNENEHFEKYSFGMSGYQETTYGPEAALAYYLATQEDLKDEEWFIIKYAAPGTNLDLHWQQNQNLTAEMLAYVESCVGELTNDYDVQIRSLLWMQGENDALDAGCASRYAENEQNMVRTFRTKFAKYASNPNPEIPGSGIAFIDAGIAPAGKDGNTWKYAAEVNAAKVSNAYIWYVPGSVTELSPLYGLVNAGGRYINPNAAGIYNSAFIDTSLMSAQENDAAHYDQQSMDWLGTWFGQYVQHMINAELPSAPSTGPVEECIVVYEANGGVTEKKYIVVNPGSTVTLPTVTKEGNKFLGWSDGTNLYAIGAQVAITNDAAFVAQWQDKFTITVNNGTTDIVVELAGMNADNTAKEGQYVVPTLKNNSNSMKLVVVKDQYGKTCYRQIVGANGTAYMEYWMPADNITFTITAYNVNLTDGNSNFDVTELKIDENNELSVTVKNTSSRSRNVTVKVGNTTVANRKSVSGNSSATYTCKISDGDVTITIS